MSHNQVTRKVKSYDSPLDSSLLISHTAKIQDARRSTRNIPLFLAPPARATHTDLGSRLHQQTRRPSPQTRVSEIPETLACRFQLGRFGQTAGLAENQAMYSITDSRS
jgi:hypothetical protein